MPSIDWSLYFPEEIIQRSTAFWSNVRTFKDAGGSQPFEKLAKFALKILSLPLSNAVVERVILRDERDEDETAEQNEFRHA